MLLVWILYQYRQYYSESESESSAFPRFRLVFSTFTSGQGRTHHCRHVTRVFARARHITIATSYDGTGLKTSRSPRHSIGWAIAGQKTLATS
jgi:hypothetical protein